MPSEQPKTSSEQMPEKKSLEETTIEEVEKTKDPYSVSEHVPFEKTDTVDDIAKAITEAEKSIEQMNANLTKDPQEKFHARIEENIKILVLAKKKLELRLKELKDMTPEKQKMVKLEGQLKELELDNKQMSSRLPQLKAVPRSTKNEEIVRKLEVMIEENEANIEKTKEELEQMQ